MKKALSILSILLIVLSLSACGVSFSKSNYKEISSYVLENKDVIPHKSETEFYIHETVGISPNTVYYGYYFSGNNEVAFADFYEHDNLGAEIYESDGGTYFGKPSTANDWYFTKKITDNWFYFELHQNLI